MTTAARVIAAVANAAMLVTDLVLYVVMVLCWCAVVAYVKRSLLSCGVRRQLGTRGATYGARSRSST